MAPTLHKCLPLPRTSSFPSPNLYTHIHLCSARQVPVLVVTDSAACASACAPIFAAVPYVVGSLPSGARDLAAEVLLEKAVISAVQAGLCQPGHEVIVLQVRLWPRAYPLGRSLASSRLPFVGVQQTPSATRAVAVKDTLQGHPAAPPTFPAARPPSAWTPPLARTAAALWCPSRWPQGAPRSTSATRAAPGTRRPSACAQPQSRWR